MWDFQAALDPRTPSDALCLRTLVVSLFNRLCSLEPRLSGRKCGFEATCMLLCLQLLTLWAVYIITILSGILVV